MTDDNIKVMLPLTVEDMTATSKESLRDRILPSLKKWFEQELWGMRYGMKEAMRNHDKELSFEEDVRILMLDTCVETDRCYVIYEEKFKELRKGVLELVRNWLPSMEDIGVEITRHSSASECAVAIRKLIMEKLGLKE